MCSSNEMFKLRCNELTQEQYLNSLLNQKIQRVHTITHSHTSDSPTRIPLAVGYHPATPPLNIINFSQTHLHSLILPTLATLFKYIPLVTFLRTNKREIR